MTECRLTRRFAIGQPIISQSIPNLDFRHAIDQRFEIVSLKVLAYVANAFGNVVFGHIQRDAALQLSSAHASIYRTACALAVAHHRKTHCSPMRIAILTVSTAGAAGKRKDSSGDAIAAWALEHKFEIVGRTLVADEVNAIVRQLLEWCDAEQADLVLTTGGTGLSPTDVTPEATQVVIERDAPGIAEWLRVKSVNNFPKAALSRGRSGVRNRTLIVNLPGSPGGVKDSLNALDPIVDHAIAVLRGEITDHVPNTDASTRAVAARPTKRRR